MSVFSERLTQLRKKQGLSQVAAAKLLHIAHRTYQDYECGKTEPQLSALIRIADYYQITLDYLAGRTDRPLKPSPLGEGAPEGGG